MEDEVKERIRRNKYVPAAVFSFTLADGCARLLKAARQIQLCLNDDGIIAHAALEDLKTTMNLWKTEGDI